MGLDFSNCDAHWSYSGFFRFRLKIAKQLDFPEYEEIKTTNDKRYAKLGKDPIKHLLAHSDCDGHLTPKQCKELAPRLKEIISIWPDIDHDKQIAAELIKGLEDSIETKKNLEFC